jgi:hypothetical protein
MKFIDFCDNGHGVDEFEGHYSKNSVVPQPLQKLKLDLSNKFVSYGGPSNQFENMFGLSPEIIQNEMASLWKRH